MELTDRDGYEAKEEAARGRVVQQLHGTDLCAELRLKDRADSLREWAR